MVTKKNHEHNGVEYTKVESSISIDGVLGTENKKFILHGVPAIEATEKQYKYPSQVTISVYNYRGATKEEPRVQYAGTYDRIEIIFDKSEFVEMCKQFLEVAGNGGADNPSDGNVIDNAARLRS